MSVSTTDPQRQLPPANPCAVAPFEAALRRISSAALVLGCDDLAQVGLWDTGSCCPHCHDIEGGYPAHRPTWAPPVELVVTTIAGRVFATCCKASLAIKSGRPE